MVTGSGKYIRRIGEEPPEEKLPEKPKEKPKVESCHHVLRKHQTNKCEVKQKAKTCKGCHHFYI
jgi:hypothetical protein